MTTLCILMFAFMLLCTLVALAVCRASGRISRLEEGIYLEPIGSHETNPFSPPGKQSIKDDEQ